jgi:glycosyltransferase involved in cell wall biosynthesis
MRVLIISYWYAPGVNPRALRWSSVAADLVRRGHQVRVLSARHAGLPATELREGVDVHRTGRAPGLAAAGSGAPTADPATSRRRRIGRWLYDRTWKRVYWPDTACLWWWPAVRAARELIARFSPAAVISVSDPFTSHLVALAAAAGRGSRRWIVDIGDPFALRPGMPANNPALYRRLNYRAERRVLAAADAVALTNEPCRIMYASLYPEAAGRTRVIAPLLPPEPVPEADSPFPTDGRIRLVFAGTLHRGVREPGPLLALFAALRALPLGRDAELHVFGHARGFEAEFAAHGAVLGRAVFAHGLVSHATAYRAMREASLLVNIGNRTTHQLPSKLVEYASTGRPILSLTPPGVDTSDDFLKEYPALLRLADDDVGAAAAARLAAFLGQAPAVDPVALAAFLGPFRIEAIGRQYEELLG